MGGRMSEIEFVNYVVSGSIVCECGQHHVFLGVMSITVHACESCGWEYRLVPPRLTVEEVCEG